MKLFGQSCDLVNYVLIRISLGMCTLDVITGSARRTPSKKEEAGSVQGDMGSRHTEETPRRQKKSRDMEGGVRGEKGGGDLEGSSLEKRCRGEPHGEICGGDKKEIENRG